MKLSTHKLLAIFAALAALSFSLPCQTAAQTFTNLYSFSAFDPPSSWLNSDGGWPSGGVILSGNTLFATTTYGSSFGWGTVFAVNTNGSGFTSLYQFSGGSDGKWPSPGMVLSSNTLYGATIGGGNGVGNIFAINTDGSGFTDLYDFTAPPGLGFPNTNADGSVPGYLAVSDDTLYGVATEGGLYANGTLFSLNIDGSGFTTLHNFAANGAQSPGLGYPNNDGAGPNWLIVSGGTLYGTAQGGGHSGYGTVFKLNSDSTGFTVLHHFTAPKGSLGNYGTNTDGAIPGNLILSGNKLYGTTMAGGVAGGGTVFGVNTDGTGFAVLYSSNRLFVKSRLIASSNTLYWWSWGNVSEVNTDGSGLLTFPSGGPSLVDSGLIMSGDTLYGLLPHGGDSGNGAVFSCLVPPRLSLVPGGTNASLAWPTNYPGYVLQSATTLNNGGDWRDTTTVPDQTNGENVTSISTSGSAGFFRLRHP